METHRIAEAWERLLVEVVQVISTILLCTLDKYGLFLTFEDPKSFVLRFLALSVCTTTVYCIPALSKVRSSSEGGLSWQAGNGILAKHVASSTPLSIMSCMGREGTGNPRQTFCTDKNM